MFTNLEHYIDGSCLDAPYISDKIDNNFQLAIICFDIDMTNHIKVLNLNVTHIIVNPVFSYMDNDWISQCLFNSTKSFL